MLTHSVFSFSQTHPSVEKARRDVEPFSSFGKPFVERFFGESRFGECAGFSCPNDETVTTSLKRKLVMRFQENAQLRQDYLKRSLNWTEENGGRETLILLFMKLAYSSNTENGILSGKSIY